MMKPYYECKHGVIYHGDCLDIMPRLGVKVDAVITDPPYGTTACAWDSVIPFADMWAAIDAVRKDNTAVCLFGSEPFSSALRMSNVKQFKYDWIWEKEQSGNFMLCKYQPYKVHEIISIFYNNKYYPIMEKGLPYTSGKGTSGEAIRNYRKMPKKNIGERYPRSIQKNNRDKNGYHPTVKPTALLAYLIKTYTNAGELVLDFTAGSGTTAVAAINTGRRFIGIELEEKYCEISAKRIEQAMYNNSMLNL